VAKIETVRGMPATVVKDQQVNGIRLKSEKILFSNAASKKTTLV